MTEKFYLLSSSLFSSRFVCQTRGFWGAFDTSRTSRQIQSVKTQNCVSYCGKGIRHLPTPWSGRCGCVKSRWKVNYDLRRTILKQVFLKGKFEFFFIYNLSFFRDFMQILRDGSCQLSVTVFSCQVTHDLRFLPIFFFFNQEYKVITNSGHNDHEEVLTWNDQTFSRK